MASAAGTGQAEADAYVERVEAGSKQLYHRLLDAYLEAGEWQSGLRAVGYELRRFLIEDPERAREMVLESAGADDERARAIRDRGIQQLTGLIDFGRTVAPDPASIPPSTAALTAGAIYNRIHLALERGTDQLSTEMVRELLYIAVLPFLGREAALAELRTPPPPGA